MAGGRVAVVAGDGIGPEVVEQAVRIAGAAAAQAGARLQWQRFPWGSAYYRETGRMLPVEGMDILRSHDAILMGAVGSPDLPDHVTLHGLLLPMRRQFDLYVNIRPAYLFDGVKSPLRDKSPGSI